MFSPVLRQATPATTMPAIGMEHLEQRRLLNATAVAENIKVRNVSENNLSTNQSVVTIPFSEPITLVDATKIRIRGYAINPVTGAQKKIIIRIEAAQQIDDQHIQLTTDRLLRKGAYFYFDPGSLTHQSDGTDIPEHRVRSPRGQNKERFTLASRTFTPTAPSLFDRDLYPGTEPRTADTALSENTVRDQLTAFLNRRAAVGTITAGDAATAIARFDETFMRNLVPSPNLRAALLSLTGTFAEFAIDTFTTANNLSGRPYTILAIAETREAAPIADTQVTDTGRLRVRVRPEFQGEPFTALAAVLAHEALHQDTQTSIEEELLATLFEAVAYAQQIDTSPNTPLQGTKLVVDENTSLLALLNSGQSLFPIVGPEAPHPAALLRYATGVFSNSTPISAGEGGPYLSFEDFVRRSYEARGGQEGDTNGNATLSSYVSQFTGQAYSGKFNDALVATLDENLYPVLTNPLAIRAAGLLRLTVS